MLTSNQLQNYCLSELLEEWKLKPKNAINRRMKKRFFLSCQLAVKSAILPYRS